MPELPEVEAVVRKLRREAVGATIRHCQVFRPRITRPQPPARLEDAIGLTIEAVERRGKNIIVRLPQDLRLRVHLGMTGNFHVIPDANFLSKTVRALLTFNDGRGLALDDARLLGCIQLHSTADLEQTLNQLGVDALSRKFTCDFFCEAARASSRPAKLFLMDQRPVCGLGNIYAAEALFRARIHPERPMGALKTARLRTLHEAIREVLREAIPAAVRSYTRPGDHSGMNMFVYGRAGQPCRVCGRNIQRIEQGGRSTYFCPKCQRA